MRVHRGLLLAILLYVALDLSLPMMPGAFVFEPDDSVESTQMNRGRPAADAAILTTPVREPLALRPLSVEITVRLTPALASESRRYQAAHRPSRTALDSTSLSEDPH